ncbi:dynein regulatory complex protein 1-like [Centruroides vittatus]|uniref:dynein regulatory complex protein 1-like n=1 Tax=Centruroides vittatus TaxID=120091 RepID=UPI0035108DC6
MVTGGAHRFKNNNMEKKGEILNCMEEEMELLKARDRNISEKNEEYEKDELPDRIRWNYQNGLLDLTGVAIKLFQRESERQKEEETLNNSKKQIRELEDSIKMADGIFDQLKEKWSKDSEGSSSEEYETFLALNYSIREILTDKEKKIMLLREQVKKKDEKFDSSLEYLRENVLTLTKKSDKIFKKFFELTKTEFERSVESLERNHKNMIQNQVNNNIVNLSTHLNNETKFKELEFQEEEQKTEIYDLEMKLTKKTKEIQRQLENEIQEVTLLLREMRTECYLNEAKLEHNIQVLQRRETESIRARAEQKKKLNRLKDQEIFLMNEYSKLTREGHLEIKKLLKNIELLTSRMTCTKLKSDYRCEVNKKQFRSIWVSQEDEAKELLEKVKTADRIIHEQILRRKWKNVDTSFIQNRGPLSSKIYSHAILPPVTKQQIKDDWPRSLRCLLEKICNEMGFVIEEKVLAILKHLPKDGRSLISVDVIFEIFDIKDKASLQKLTKYLTKYTEIDDSENCSNLISSEGIMNAFIELAIDFRLEANLASHNDSNDSDSIKTSKYEFGEKDEVYWNKYTTAFPKSRICLWDGLFQIQKKYLCVLKKRAELMDRIEQIEQQNKDLQIALERLRLHYN